MPLVRPLLGVLLEAILLWSTPAHATTVAIVRPASASQIMTEALGRIRGELASVGFATEMIDEPVMEDVKSGHASRAWLEQLASRRGFDAAIAIMGDSSPDSVQVWVVDKITKKSVVRTVPLGPVAEEVPKTLSIRAIELLRSSLLEIELFANEKHPDASTVPSPAVVQLIQTRRLVSRRERLGVELGGVAVMSLDGVGPAFLPVLGFDWAIHQALAGQVMLAGLGTHPTVGNQEGTAEIAQAYGLLGVCYSFLHEQRLRPFVVLAAGVLHTSVEGRTESPANQELQGNRWSFLLDVGAGATLRLRDRLFVSLALHTQMAKPRLAIRVVDEVVASSAGPNLALSLAMGAWL
jgi:hypothetical protein